MPPTPPKADQTDRLTSIGEYQPGATYWVYASGHYRAALALPLRGGVRTRVTVAYWVRYGTPSQQIRTITGPVYRLLREQPEARRYRWASVETAPAPTPEQVAPAPEARS